MVDATRQTFESLPYETRKAKVLTMLEELQNVSPQFMILYNNVQALQIVPDELLLYCYTTILDMADDIKAGKVTETDERLKKISAVINKIREAELLDKQQDGDIEQMLAQL